MFALSEVGCVTFASLITRQTYALGRQIKHIYQHCR